MSNVTEIDTLIEEIMSLEANDGVDYFAQCAFEGFDPSEIFVKIAKIVKQSDENKGLLRFTITFGLTRGFGGKKTFEKIIDRTGTQSGQKNLRTAITVFGLTTDKKAKNVTIDRLMAAFPNLTFKIWNALVAAGKVHDKVPNYSGTLPIKFRYPGSPAAMSDACWALHSSAYIDWSIQLQTIWRANRTEIPMPDRATTLKFAELQQSTILWKKERREAS